MELELGLALPNPRPPHGGELGGLLLAGEKRGFHEAFVGAVKAKLPLFVRDDDEGGGGGGGGRVVVDRERPNKRKRLVGWPPVKHAHRRSSGGGYVKVKMEGVAIGRKVDVPLLGSYDELLRALGRMFPPPAADDQGAVPCHAMCGGGPT